MFLLKQLVRWERRAGSNLRRAWFIVFMLMAVCFSMTLIQHFANLWKKEHYQFAPVLLAACCAIGFGRWREAAQGKLFFPKFRVQPLIALLSALAFALAVWINSPWCGFLSLIAFGWMLSRNVPFLTGPVLLLTIMLPLPLMMDQEVVHGLQRVSSSGASVLLDLVRIPHIPEGNVVETSSRRFFVEEACSGFGSVYLLVAIAGLIIVLKRLRLCVALPLMVTAPVWAVAANIARIFAVVWAYDRKGLNLADGLNHEILGIGTYALAVVGLLISEQALLFFLTPIGSHGRPTPGTRRERMQNWLIEFWDSQTDGNWQFQQTLVLRRGISGIGLSSGGAPVFCGALLLFYLGGWVSLEGYRFLCRNLQPETFEGEISRTDSGSRSMPVSQMRVISCESSDSAPEEGVSERWKIEYLQRQWDVEATGLVHPASLKGTYGPGVQIVEQASFIARREGTG